MTQIHPTAIISDGAVIGEDCTIGAYSVIGPKVVIGRGSRVGPHVVIEGHTTLGDENTIFQFASVGAVPQDLKFAGEDSQLIIGNRNIIREYVTLQPGTNLGGMKTIIGDGNLFMACCHVAHDCLVGNSNVFANSCAVAGHVTIGNRVTVGGLSGLHQFSRIGDLAIIGAGAMVAKDVPPFCMAQGDRAFLIGLNRIGLKRSSVSTADISRLKQLYRKVFFSSGRLVERIEATRAEFSDFELGNKFLDFISSDSKRGIVTPRRGAGAEDEDNPDV